VDGLRERIQSTRGIGNFKNVMFYSPNGKSDGIKILPISEIAAKDDFLAIKNTSRDDILAMHRVPLALMSIPATNAGGHGNAREAAAVFFENELRPLIKKMSGINAYFGAEAVAFGDYPLMIERG
jgi:capsid portal protein